MILIVILKIINNVLATVSAVYACAQILVFFINLDFLTVVKDVLRQDEIGTTFDFAVGLYQLHLLDVERFIICQLNGVTKTVTTVSFSQMYFYGKWMVTFFREEVVEIITHLDILTFLLNQVLFFIPVHIKRINGMPPKGHVEGVVKLFAGRGIFTNLNRAFNGNRYFFHKCLIKHGGLLCIRQVIDHKLVHFEVSMRPLIRNKPILFVFCVNNHNLVVII